MCKNKSPIFITGVDRSGTTLLALMLDTHSKITILYESDFFVRFYQDRELFSNLKDKKDRLALVKSILSMSCVKKWNRQIAPEEINLDKCNNLQNTINEIYSTYAQSLGKEIWGDKNPMYIDHLYVLNELFPSSRFIHIIRDGRDVALSIMKQWWGANDFTTAIRYWEKSITCVRKMLRMLNQERYIELRFEDLVSNPAQEIKKITDFLGVDFEEAMVRDYTQKAFDKVGNGIKQHHVHLTKPPSSSQAFKWQKTLKPGDQAIAYQIAGNTLVELGYPKGITSHHSKIMREAYHRLREAYVWRIGKKVKPKDIVISDDEKAYDIVRILRERKKQPCATVESET